VSSAVLHPNARSALRTRLEAMSGALPRKQLAYEGYSYDPVPLTPFIEDELVGIGDIARANGAIEHALLYNLTLKYPSDKGTADIEAMAGKLLDHFKVGTKLTYGATTVTCMGAERRGKISYATDWATLLIQVRLWSCTTE
jgi:hypothetical protein